MLRIISALAASMGLALCLGCASHQNHNLESLQVGMDKDDVLRISGNPWITRRINSEDLWIYRFYKEDQQYRKELRFLDGRLKTINPTLPHPNSNDQLAESESMDEYKKAAEAKNSAYEKGFKDITPSDEGD